MKIDVNNLFLVSLLLKVVDPPSIKVGMMLSEDKIDMTDPFFQPGVASSHTDIVANKSKFSSQAFCRACGV